MIDSRPVGRQASGRAIVALRGWVRVPGTAGRYRPPTALRAKFKREGKLRAGTVSRRTYENERVQKAGWRNWSDYQRARKSDDYNRLVNRAIVEQGLTRRDIGPESEFSQLYLEMEAEKEISGERDLSPEGPLARMLVYVGLRDPEWEWDVGDTPGET